MQSSQENTLTTPAKGATGLGVGLFFLITAIATLVAVVTRVSANADQPTLAESLVAISENKALYASGGGARFVSGVTLVVAAWFLSKTGTGENQPSVRIVSLIFALSGLFTAVSGGSAIALANAAPAPPDTLPETTAYVRWLTGKIGFTLAGLALLPEARRQWNLGTPFKYLAPRLGCHRHFYAIHLVGRRHYGPPNHRYRLPLLACNCRRTTAQGPSQACPQDVVD